MSKLHLFVVTDMLQLKYGASTFLVKFEQEQRLNSLPF